MKLAVASDNQVNVTGHLGRCRGFIVYTIEEKKIINKDYRQNTFTHHALHGHHDGHEHNHSHQGLINGLKDCSVVFFNSGGWRVVEDLKNNNIYPFLTDETNADEAIYKYISGILEEIQQNICRSH